MFCTRKTGAIALMAFFTTVSATTYAQVKEQTPPPQNQQSPQKQLKSNQSANVSDGELKKFASVYQEVQKKSQDAQQEMIGLIKKGGMDLERFNELKTAKLQNQKVDADKSEMKSFKKIDEKLEAMQPKLQKDLDSTIASSGLSVDRFREVAAAIQSDPKLQERFVKLMPKS